MALLNLSLIITLLLLQYPLWVGTGSLADVYRLQQQQAEQQRSLSAQHQRNHSLLAEIRYLRRHSDAVEARARYDLGLVRPGETYYQLIQHD